jgi:hypothetical protein
MAIFILTAVILSVSASLTQTVEAVVRLVNCGPVRRHCGRDGQTGVEARSEGRSLIQLADGLAETSHCDAALTQLAQTSGKMSK